MPTATLTDRAVLRIAGADARDFLQGLLTNDLALLDRQPMLYAGLLTAQGKALFDMILHAGNAGAVLIDVESARAEDLRRKLTMYRLRRVVTIDVAPVAVVAAWGEDAADRPRDPRLAALGARWLADDSGDAGDSEAWHTHRLSLGIPEGAAELGVDRTLWLETDAAELNGVSFTKGCYVGQENTARMHHRDRVRRRLLPVRLTAPAGDATRIMAGDREAGELRAVRGALGMAFLRVEHADAALTLADAPLTVAWPEFLPRD